MNDKIERQSIRKRSLNHKAEVKPQGCEASADLLIVRQSPEKPMFNDQLMEAVCDRSNLQRALKRVCRNKLYVIF